MSPDRPSAPARRRLDVGERRDTILAAALSVYAERPYAEVPVADVATAAGASQALVFHYFGSKAGLYAAVVQAAVDALTDAQADANAGLAPGVPVRDRVRAGLVAYLDHIATHPLAWASPLRGGVEPVEAHEVRQRARTEQAQRLARLLGTGGWARHAYALEGFFGFIDGACLRWVDAGCPADEREPLIEAALGALQGALGDWAV